jgi:hypothetical protein
MQRDVFAAIVRDTMHTLPKGGTPWTLPPLPPSPRQSRLASVVVINPGKGNVALRVSRHACSVAFIYSTWFGQGANARRLPVTPCGPIPFTAAAMAYTSIPS